MRRAKMRERREEAPAEVLSKFKDAIAEMKARGHEGDALRNTLAIACRHFVHPLHYNLATALMALGAEACGDELDSQGVWGACRGELWLREALATEQYQPEEDV